MQLVSVPMSHSTGFNFTTAGLLMGHHLVLMPHFEANEFLRLGRVSRLGGADAGMDDGTGQ